ncbi:IclR family transcriptional regulator [Roseovarius sp. 2305UL8-3]|uniref:IclR family transcriptional regulator n=1 Tax=Roseovarius conchicola TaxID=3121636 RepID=UPI00352945B4
MSSLKKAIDVLSCFSTELPNLSVTEVAKRTSLSKSGASRLMVQMAELGLLYRAENERKYGPGSLLLQLGAVFEQRMELLPIVESEVVSAVRLTGRTGYIGALNGSEIVALRTIQGREQVRFVLEAGQKLAAHKTSLGKALLARLSNDEIRQRYSQDLGAPVSHAPTSFSELFDELDQVRVSLVAEAEVATIPGARGIGAAVGDSSNNESATIGFSLSYLEDGASSRTRFETQSYTKRIARNVAKISGDPIWSVIKSA